MLETESNEPYYFYDDLFHHTFHCSNALKQQVEVSDTNSLGFLDQLANWMLKKEEFIEYKQAVFLQGEHILNLCFQLQNKKGKIQWMELYGQVRYEEFGNPYDVIGYVSPKKERQLDKMNLQMQEDILHSMQNFRIQVQPIVDCKTHSIVAAETLLRWKYLDEEVPPFLFIDMLEKQGWIATAGRWVFEQAVCVCKKILPYHPEFFMSINVSLHQLQDQTFLIFIQDCLKKYTVPAKNIILEFTESFMDTNEKRVRTFIEGCQSMHIQLAIDDFGTGYSSIVNVFKYKSDIVKIDRDLLLEMEKSKEQRNFGISLIQTFTTLGKKVIVEGMETQSQLDCISQSSCDWLQGYYFYKPMEVSEFISHIASCIE